MTEKEGIFVSICIPTYHRTEYVRGAIQCCLDQTYPHFEVIISDDSAHDEIRKVAESFHSEKIRYFKNNPPLGISRKLNDFLDKAVGNWMVILCDDDLFEPEYLATLVAHLRRHPEATLARCRYKLMDADGQIRRLDVETPVVLGPFEHLSRIFLPNREMLTMNITGVLFPKELMKKMGGFKDLYEGLHLDRIAWAELGVEGLSICDPAPLCRVRIHTGSVSAASFRIDYEQRISAVMGAKAAIEKLLERMSGRTRSNEDERNLDLAKKNSLAYIDRSLRAATDKNLIAILSQQKENILPEVEKVFNKMKGLSPRPFRSARIYRMLSFMPLPIRIFFLGIIKKKKLKNFGNLLKES
ncbi:MAG: hypothetical protein A3C47_06655 [Omnitrophica bacterium RIFCSPHIGHO2_02_FULL_51_18]|nr:MAG: hypothetical protein A3C47_06655 [Omnitrophica bacterium RIFCSPHIGHO2_02_FULL_51_18]